MLDDSKRRDVHDFERGPGRDSTGGVRSRSRRAVQGEAEGGVGREAAGAVMAAESAGSDGAPVKNSEVWGIMASEVLGRDDASQRTLRLRA
jgi:hypothetical protein